MNAENVALLWIVLELNIFQKKLEKSLEVKISYDFMLKGKSLLEYTNLVSPIEYKKMTK